MDFQTDFGEDGRSRIDIQQEQICRKTAKRHPLRLVRAILLCLNETNGALYATLYTVALLLLLFARESHGVEAEIGPFLPLDEYFRAHEYVPGFALFNLIGNSVVFAPMGIIIGRLPVPFKFKLLGLLCVIALVIPSLEILQLFFKVGWFDYYDWIFNGISAVLGFFYACIAYRKDKKI